MLLMSVDLESWVHRKVYQIPLSQQTKELDGGHVLDATRIILRLFKKYNVRATFFTLGVIVEWYPELIQEIVRDGHEIGIHGYTHQLLYEHSEKTFDLEINKTVTILKKYKIRANGYRATAFTKADFMYRVLKKYNIVYDSSVFPIKTPLYDGTEYDSAPFIIENGIIEIPCSVLNVLKLRIPVGGFYLRLFGAWFNNLILKKIERNNDIGVIYLHPWEILKIPQKNKDKMNNFEYLNLLKRVFAFYKIPMTRKLEFLLIKNNFVSFQDGLELVKQKINN
jgi:peptidoglycan-N-acetylglucosamine deacetylase